MESSTEPRLFEDIFPYTSVPRIVFDGPMVEHMDGRVFRIDAAAVAGRDIFITDTTFRDGQQARPPYTVKQIVDLLRLLHKLSGPNGVVRQTEFFIYTRKDREAVEKCMEEGFRYPEITGWIRAHEGDFRFVKEMGLKETGILTSCSDYHIYYKLRSDRRRIIEEYAKIVETALEAGVRPRCHLEDITRADIDGFVVPYVRRLMKISEGAPDHLKVKIRLCDTMGFGVTYPGSALPRSIPKIILKMVHDAGVDSSRLEWHGHNDFHKVHINAATAWLYGCDGLNASLLGIGERTGNPPLEGALIEYAGLKGDMNGADPRAITEIADYFRREMGYPIPPNYPFAGSEFNVTRAGIHAEGMRRDERIYNIFDTEAVLGVPPRVAITDKSGVDGIVVWVNEFLGLRGAERLNKLKVHKIARWVMDQYEVHGRTTAITSEEMAEQVRIHLPEYCDAQKDGPSAGRQHGSGRLFSTGAEDGKDGADRS